MMSDSNLNKPCRILIIDDNEDIHEDFRKILCENRHTSSQLLAAEAFLFNEPSSPVGNQSIFELDSAFHAEPGLAKVYHAIQEGRPYEMAFVDVRMPPGWDGIEVTPRLWVADPDLQIVICSAYSDYSWEQMFARVGSSDRMYILNKPFDRAEVLQLAHTLPMKRRMQQEAKLKQERLRNALQSRDKVLKTVCEKLQTEIADLKGDSQSMNKSPDHS